MRLSQLAVLAGFAAVLALAGAARAETKVELKGVHLCCPGCTKAVGDILKKVDDVKGACDAKAGTVTITHGPIADLKWPGMTMDFALANAALAGTLKPGDAVAFSFVERSPGEWVIVKLDPAPAGHGEHAGH